MSTNLRSLTNLTNPTNTASLALTGLALAALLGAVACGGAGDDAAQDLTRDETLTRLGVNTQLGARKGADGKAVASSYHPLTRRHRTLAPLSELYFAGVSLNGKLQGLLDDNKTGALAELYSDTDGSWTSLPLSAAKGDVDGDGRDEIVVVYYVEKDQQLVLKVIDRAQGGYASSTTTLASKVALDARYASIPEPIRAAVIGLSMPLALGDLDNDGRDEIALGFGDTLRIFDDAKAKHAQLAARSFASPDASTPYALLRLGVGSFSVDGKQRLFVLNTLANQAGAAVYTDYYLFEGCLTKELDSDQLTVRAAAQTLVVTTANLAVGDVDGDHLDEIVLNATIGSAQALVVMDDQRAGGAILADTLTPVAGAGLALLDLDGDGIKEIAAGSGLYELGAQDGKLASLGGLGLTLGFSAAVGDLDGDLREDLIVADGGAIRILGTEASGAFKQRAALTAQSVALAPALVAANLDDDSLIVEYTGKQELAFSDPQVLAVLAAAPAHSGIGQQDGSTTFGRSKGTEAETSASLGVSVGFTIGAKAGFKLFGNGVEVQAKRTFKASMNVTATASTSIETSYAFTGGADEDKVVFTAVPFDVYYYKVLSSPDASAVGQIISINLPRQPQTFSVSRTYFNANNGAAVDVGVDVLAHTIGDPWSYPTRTDRDRHLSDGLALLKQGWVNASNPTLGGWLNDTMVTVGQGSGSQMLTIEATRSIGAGVEVELSHETEVEATLGPAVVGGSLEFSVGVGLSITAGEGFFVEGTIGDIPAAAFSGDKLYRAGLYAYPHQGSGGQQFMVVNYWVEK